MYLWVAVPDADADRRERLLAHGVIVVTRARSSARAAKATSVSRSCPRSTSAGARRRYSETL